MLIRVETDGSVLHAHSDGIDLAPLLGPGRTRRASHVEQAADLSDQAIGALPAHFDLGCQLPADCRETLTARWPGAWWADMTPCQGPLLGPLPTRAAALAAEAGWVQTHVIEKSKVARPNDGSNLCPMSSESICPRPQIRSKSSTPKPPSPGSEAGDPSNPTM